MLTSSHILQRTPDFGFLPFTKKILSHLFQTIDTQPNNTEKTSHTKKSNLMSLQVSTIYIHNQNCPRTSKNSKTLLLSFNTFHTTHLNLPAESFLPFFSRFYNFFQYHFTSWIYHTFSNESLLSSVNLHFCFYGNVITQASTETFPLKILHISDLLVSHYDSSHQNSLPIPG